MKRISLGAEAEILLDENRNVIIKRRIEKKYRIKEIDKKLRRQRTRRESKIMEKVRRLGIDVPRILETREFEIMMEYIDGKKLSEVLEIVDYRKIGREIGRILGRLHKNGIVNGDPTTSNFILKDEKIYLIDFGLSEHAGRVEDFAVDILLLKRAILSKHPKIFEEFWKEFKDGYREEFDKAKEVFRRVLKIEERGRYQRRK